MKLTLENVIDAIINIIIVGAVYRITMNLLSWYVSQLGDEDTGTKYKMRIAFVIFFLLFAVSIITIKNLVLSYFTGV